MPAGMRQLLWVIHTHHWWEDWYGKLLHQSILHEIITAQDTQIDYGKFSVVWLLIVLAFLADRLHGLVRSTGAGITPGPCVHTCLSRPEGLLSLQVPVTSSKCLQPNVWALGEADRRPKWHKWCLFNNTFWKWGTAQLVNS